jgi:hypothetical protein
MKSRSLRIIIVVGITCLLLGCDSQPPISPNEAIKLAKEFTKTISSPPTIYAINQPMIGAGSDIKFWPDEPISRTGRINLCGDGCDFPITYTTIVTPVSGGPEVDVTFMSTWLGMRTDKQAESHEWLFHVNNDRTVDFIREEGDKLPQTPG